MMKLTRAFLISTLVLAGMLLITMSAAAQSDTSNNVSDDQVNDIAEHMYCPVCENEPLDDCRTSTCIQWKEEIRDMIAAGMTEEEIQSEFVANHGQHVLGVPQAPILRLLSFLIPIVGVFVAVVIGALALAEFQRNRPEPLTDASNKPKRSPDDEDDNYRQMLESDLN